MQSRLSALLLFLASVCFGQLKIADVKVEGNSRLPAAGIIAASGLRTGATVPKSALDAAGKTLFDTGLFTGFNYRYDPKPGAAPPAYIVTLMVIEDRGRTPVVLDIPNYPEDQLWSDLKSSNPLIDKIIPDSDAASNYYARAIESVLTKAGRHERLSCARRWI